MRVILASVILIAATLTVLAPATSADHTCNAPDFVVPNPAFRSGMYTGDCYGVWTTALPFACSPGIWGVHADSWGVGGTHQCEVGVYFSWDVEEQDLPVLL